MDCMLGGLEEIKNMVKRNHGKETFCRHKTDGKTRKGKIVFLRAMANKGTSIIQSPSDSKSIISFNSTISFNYSERKNRHLKIYPLSSWKILCLLEKTNWSRAQCGVYHSTLK